MNGDGKTDFIATRGHGRGVIWFEAPTWREHVIHETLLEPHSLVVVDLDGDGDLDAATCAYGDKQAFWFENDGKGKFTNHLVAEDQAAYDIRAVDLDADGDLDLLIAGQNSKNVAWYENPHKKTLAVGWKAGDAMPFHVVDFAAGPRSEGGGCPAVMISNSRGRGLIVWSKSCEPADFELAAALDGKLGNEKKPPLGFLLHFSNASRDELRKLAETHGLKRFQVAAPRSMPQGFATADATGKSGTLVFFLDRKEIIAVHASESGQLTKERIAEIAAAAEKFLAGK